MSHEQKLPRQIEYVRLSDIEFAPRNPKQHADALISASIDEFGLAEIPLRDDRTGRLVAGHGRITDLRRKHAAGQAPPDGVLLDGDGEWLAPVVTGWQSRSDRNAETYLLGSNRIGEAGGWHDPSLAESLRDLAEHDTDLVKLTGFGPEELTRLLADLSGAADGDGSGGPGGGVPMFEPVDDAARLDQVEPKCCPSCGFRWHVGAGGRIVPADSGDGEG